MECFWDTVDTIGEGFGFSLFGARHLVTLALYIAFATLSCKRYKAADEKRRAQLRKLFAVLLLADEAFKQIGLQIGGNFNWDYLPLHLCSINIFLIALHAWKPNRLLNNFLYFICIPAATAAPICCVNLLLDTNFMFLMYAPDGNPLAWFRDRFGYHWIGFPVLLAAVFALMDVPVLLKGRQENKAIRAAE